jgi:glutathionyl-hydroquinone reductase
MARIDISGSSVGNALQDILTAADIVPGDQPSYEVCKILWLFHPLGLKMVEGPIAMAQQQPREISVPNSPKDRVRDKFIDQWKKDRCDDVIYSVCSVARAYGIGTLAIVEKGVDVKQPLDFKKIADAELAFSVFDPLNTAGSLVLNQDPNAIDFMKYTAVSVGGKVYHRSRTVTLMNEHPVYIAYTTSAFGFVGRSVFQRALFPLKSFIQSMVTDDLITKKAGVFIAMLKTAGAIIDRIMQASAALKRLFVQEATNGNVISIGADEKIETLNMQNIDGAYGMARKNILENIATAADMPAILLKQETFAEGFGEGTEDSKLVAGYINAYRRHVQPVYDFMDRITMRRAWNEEFFRTIQNDFPEYKKMRYEDAFYRWSNDFTAAWPNMLQEPDSEKVKWDDVKLKGVIAAVEVFGPIMDPENKARLVQFAVDSINENKIMFQSPLEFDYDEFVNYTPPEAMEEPAQPKPFAANDSAGDIARKLSRRLSPDDLDVLVRDIGRRVSRADEAPSNVRRLPRHDRPRITNGRARDRDDLPPNDFIPKLPPPDGDKRPPAG